MRGNVNEEYRASGSAHRFGASCFGPVSNLIRDSRWGRTAEMLTGEDPYLGRVMSAAFTTGIQHRPGALEATPGRSQGMFAAGNASNNKENKAHDTDDTGPRHLQSAPPVYRMINTIAKHLNTYAGPEGWGLTFGPHAERFGFEATLTEREWREFFLPAYRGAAEAGVSGFMCSYSSMTFTDHPEHSHNTPACANAYLLTKVIREEWDWEGYVLSDAGATAFIGNASIDNGTSWANECPGCHFGHGCVSPPHACLPIGVFITGLGVGAKWVKILLEFGGVAVSCRYWWGIDGGGLL